MTQEQIESIILYHLYGVSELAAEQFREAVREAAGEIARNLTTGAADGATPRADQDAVKS